MGAFIAITSGPEEGILVDNFSANGLIVAMITTLVGVKIYVYEKKCLEEEQGKTDGVLEAMV